MKIPIWIKALITLILGGLITWNIGFGRLVANLKGINLNYFLYALFVSPLVILLGTEKWYRLSKHIVKNSSRSDYLISFLGGMSIGLLTPARVGEFSRVLFLESDSKAELTGIAFIDKVIDLEVTLLLGVWSALILLDKSLFFIFSSVVALGLILLYNPRLFNLIYKVLRKMLPFEKQINLFLTGTNSISREVITKCLFLRLVISIIDLLQFHILIIAFFGVGISAALTAYPLIILVNILPITIGGIGIRESVSAIILSKFKVPPEVAVSASFLLFCVNTLLPGLVGTVFVARVKLKTPKKSLA